MDARLSPDVLVVSGTAIAPYVDDLARLRSEVFRQWPYLYDGDAAYEAGYLKVYLDSPFSVVVLVLDGDKVVGASTGLPLADAGEAFRAPFDHASIDPLEVFYCGESVLLPRYRGRGFGHRFFEEREAHARSLGGFAWTAFCAVERREDDPRRPPFHRDNDDFWRRRRYAPHPRLSVQLPWREVGGGEVDHTLRYWLRPLERVI
ncbi:GNAT family N-acetyltransferase [Marilutibacter chinensis]|uniref:GNAT family N-acetyltransferase n=1 Tax=Marilutibacter chinensis TaxID=2912247 RepID=A0ABS9HZ02_9GAMM|nr:GNAT family N-acetyltransferase [Lysobacter chinensis]MCF7223430.1 GNAT family N-acetyltransferase [Lysobacter chinensis]